MDTSVKSTVVELTRPKITIRQIAPELADTYTGAEIAAIVPMSDRYWQHKSKAPYLVFFAPGGRAPITLDMSLEAIAKKSGMVFVAKDQMLLNPHLEFSCSYEANRKGKCRTWLELADARFCVTSSESKLALMGCRTTGPETLLLKDKMPRLRRILERIRARPAKMDAA
jgi:hypothetical protein